MAVAISRDPKERIVSWYFNDEMTMKEIADMASISMGLILKVINTFDCYGQTTDPFAHRTGHPSYVDPGDVRYLESILAANPSLYLNEIQDKLAMCCNLNISLSTIVCTL
jgi:transposase